MNMELLRRWLAAELVTKNVTQGALADHLGMAHSDISRFLNGKRKQITMEQAMKAADFLKSDLPDEMFGSRRFYVKKAVLRGVIAAGILREDNMKIPAAIESVPYLPSDNFSEFEQYSYQITDNHAEDYAPPQAFVFVDFNSARDVPRNGDVVRIEQTYTIPGRFKNRQVTEGTLRRVEITPEGVVLRKLSQTNEHVLDLPYDRADERMVIRDLAIGYFVITADRKIAK